MIRPLHSRAARRIDRAAPEVLPHLARLTFAGVLLVFFWNSARTKLGEGLAGVFAPSDGAYVQVFPRVVEAAGYDTSALGSWHWLVVLAGMWAEFLLPLLLVLGLFARLAALGMVGFILVMSLTDILGHGVGGADLGAWFDGAPGALILDQRALWVLLLLVVVLLGPGRLSLDRLVGLESGGEPRQA